MPQLEEPKVLLVNDDPRSLFALQTILSDVDASIMTATSDESALQMLLKQDIAVIILDVKMSDLNGYETARIIRQRPYSKASPIIFLTAHRPTDLNRAHGYELGTVDYLFMPVAPEALKAKVQMYLELHEERHHRYDQDAKLTILNKVPQQKLQHMARLNKSLQAEMATLRKEMEAYILRQSNYDALTGLPNRLLLEDRMRLATTHPGHEQATAGLLLIDLDRFKDVNDTLGYAAGDRLLQVVAERLAQSVLEGDTVARLSGDEFVVLLAGIQSAQDAALVADKILQNVSHPCLIEGRELHISPSIGIAIYPNDGNDMDELLRNADTAMCHAKQGGRSRLSFFAPAMNDVTSQRLTISSALQRAIQQDEFTLHYQPKIETTSGAICGFEALIRWPRADGKWIPPGLFIPIAEETGRIQPIGIWALQQAANQIRTWRDEGAGSLSVAVNLSAQQFRQKNIASTIETILRDTGIPPALLEIELTESAVMSDPAQAVKTLYEIRNLGVLISIDDFGTGYSSLAYLKRFPVDKLKIDASFVRDIASDPDDAAIVTAIINLAHSLNLKVIAEGVETAAQLAFLLERGCDQTQGNYFSVAVPGDKALQLLQQERFRKEELTFSSA